MDYEHRAVTLSVRNCRKICITITNILRLIFSIQGLLHQYNRCIGQQLRYLIPERRLICLVIKEYHNFQKRPWPEGHVTHVTPYLTTSRFKYTAVQMQSKDNGDLTFEANSGC